MRINLQELRQMVDSIVAEAKKKKEKADKAERVPEPPEYRYAEAFDFSAPLGAYNLYRSQGAVNWGPHTGPGPTIDDRLYVPKSVKDAHMAMESIQKLTRVIPESSAWAPFLSEARKVQKAAHGNSVWESALHWYDFQKKGLGKGKISEKVSVKMTPEGAMELTHDHQPGPTAVNGGEQEIDEKHIGFKKLKGQLAHKKGVKDPGALAASIGRKKYGAKGMAKKAAAGRK